MRRYTASHSPGRSKVNHSVDRRAYRAMTFTGPKINTSPYIPRGGIKL